MQACIHQGPSAPVRIGQLWPQGRQRIGHTRPSRAPYFLSARGTDVVYPRGCCRPSFIQQRHLTSLTFHISNFLPCLQRFYQCIQAVFQVTVLPRSHMWAYTGLSQFFRPYPHYWLARAICTSSSLLPFATLNLPLLFQLGPTWRLHSQTKNLPH